MKGPALEFIEGTTFAFDVAWSDEGGAAVDLTGCSARFAICPAASTRQLVYCSSADGDIVLGGSAGTVAVSIPPSKTAGQYSDSWKGARYELRIYFAGGQVETLLMGPVVMTASVLP